MTQVKFNNEKWWVLHQESWVEIAQEDWQKVRMLWIKADNINSEWLPISDQIYSLSDGVEFEIKEEKLYKSFNDAYPKVKKVAHLKDSEPNM